MMKLFKGMFLILETLALAIMFLIALGFILFLGAVAVVCFGGLVYALWWVLALVLGKAAAGLVTAIITVYAVVSAAAHAQ